MAFMNHWEVGGVYRVFSGAVDGRQLLDATIKIEEDHRFDRVRYVINDFLNIDSVNVTDKEIATVAAIDRAASITNPNIRIAIVTRSEQVRDLAGLYGRMTSDSPYRTETFETVEDARRWACGEPESVSNVG